MENRKQELSEEEWLNKLGEEAYRVMRQKGTEKPFSGKFNNHQQEGKYTCKGCGNILFSSTTKFDAGCGWPSFCDVAEKSAVILQPDYSHNMIRTEVLCANCNSHLGHLFDDGPAPTNLRYCINSVCLNFEQ